MNVNLRIAVTPPAWPGNAAPLELAGPAMQGIVAAKMP
jgi:hypothetical protein